MQKGIRGPVSVFHREEVNPPKRSRNGTNLQNAKNLKKKGKNLLTAIGIYSIFVPTVGTI
jgi:hypothetical protein